MESNATSALETAGLARRLAAILYDTLLVAALLVVASALVTLPVQMGLGVKLNPAHPLFRGYLALVILGFYLYFWTHGGQTLGMNAWRLRLVRRDGRPPGIADALRRWGAAWLSLLPLGLGFLWAVVDREGLMWHDRWSGTHVVLLPGDDSPRPPRTVK